LRGVWDRSWSMNSRPGLFMKGWCEHAIGFSRRNRWSQVIDDGRMSAPLGLAALTGIINDEGIEQREIAHQKVGEAFSRQANILSRQPFEPSVFAQVRNHVRAPSTIYLRCGKPAKESGVVICERKIRRVINRIGIDAVGGRWLVMGLSRASFLSKFVSQICEEVKLIEREEIGWSGRRDSNPILARLRKLALSVI
jgi:hypothetical protein